MLYVQWGANSPQPTGQYTHAQNNENFACAQCLLGDSHAKRFVSLHCSCLDLSVNGALLVRVGITQKYCWVLSSFNELTSLSICFRAEDASHSQRKCKCKKESDSSQQSKQSICSNYALPYTNHCVNRILYCANYSLQRDLVYVHLIG